jgi:hypothetical protein
MSMSAKKALHVSTIFERSAAMTAPKEFLYMTSLLF